ncbi:MarR family winged helix-turn-helix transcriptional regulator [Paenarthrobacter sp. RAF54_2]|uniref:MarR family winged helix-turn-helix transcriptional regulator n=1 Tax=Paenarthrobacter sp. RAF54_2 TaxID=3233061 RepID=UPI003F96C221
MSASERQQEINGRLITLLNQAEAVLVERVTEALLEFDLTPTQYATLLMLGCNQGSTSAQLARFVNVTPQSMGVVVAKLEARGLISREPSKVNSRVMATKLTREGRRVMEAADEAAGMIEQQLREVLGEAEVEQFRGLLQMARGALAS